MFPALTPQVVILGLFNDSVSNICLIDKFCCYLNSIFANFEMNID